MPWWTLGRRTREAVERSEEVSASADDTFKLLATTVVRLHKTTRELEKALEEMHDATE